jgi:hypothetical protein
MTLPPSLDSARIRLRRGGEHVKTLATLEAEVCDGFLRKIEHELPDRIPAEQFMSVFESLNIKPDVPDTVAIVLGEAVYNFRAALDYAVGQVSSKQTPTRRNQQPRRNQFPIESTPAGFSARRQTFLDGVSEGVAAYIEGLQPYNHCEWTRRLADLSNLDKHNQLVDVLQAFAISFDDSEVRRMPPPRVDGTKPIVWANLSAMLRIEYRNPRKRDLLDELHDIEFSVDRTLTILDVELFKPKPTKYPGIRFPGEF